MIRFAAIFCLITLPALAGAQDYTPLIRELEPWIEREMAEKKIPSLSIAIVDGQRNVWVKGFGFADPQKKLKADGSTLYRIGSVSKPITAMLLMLFVELGLIDLDAPVQTYLPELQPKNPYAKKITLRQILAHRSGIVRESPIGNYFDGTEPKLRDAVLSLNETALLYEPETKSTYSNAALAAVGYTLEHLQKKPFHELMQQKLLGPVGLTSSSYLPSKELLSRQAKASMWTYHGKTFPAPTFELGMAPAGSMASSAEDMAKLIAFLHRRGEGLFKPGTLESMWKIQYPQKDDKAGFGLGFYVNELDGRRRIGHGGAVYGFATSLSVLPDESLGVIVMAAKDVTNAVTNRIADTALRGMIAVKENKPLPKLEHFSPLTLDEAKQVAGRYQAKDKTIDLITHQGGLWMLPPRTGMCIQVRKRQSDLITDDALGFGQVLKFEDGNLIVDKDTYTRLPETKPEPLAEKYRGLIGQYGPDHIVTTILERNGKLHALIEWIFLYPLTEIGADTFQFPDYGLYPGEKITFERDAKGKAVRCRAVNVLMERRKQSGEDGATFQIRPLRPVAELRKDAEAAKPPIENNAILEKSDLVELTKLDPSIRLDIRYASADNFLGTPVYPSARAFMQRPAAEAVVRVHQKLEKQGLGLLIHDAYRPWTVTHIFHAATPDEMKHFVADPMLGSRHNRGCAVDLTLFDRKTGKPLDIVSGYDEFSDRAYPDVWAGTSLQRYYRDLLRREMELAGFSVFESEWWHFDYHAWRRYPIGNQKFEDIGK